MKRESLSFLGLFVLVPTFLFAGVSPTLLYLNLTSDDLYDIKMIGEDDGWIVGDHGTILHWDGNSWSNVKSPTDQALWGVDFAAANDGWAVGVGWSHQEGCTILHWDGIRWVDGSSLIVDPPSRVDQWNWDGWMMRDISMVGSDDGWAVGWWSRSRKYWVGEQEVYEDEECGLLLHWNGTRWRLATKFGSIPSLGHVFMLDSSTGWIAGGDYDFTYDLYQYNGLSWTGIHEGRLSFQCIFALDSNNVWATQPNYDRGLFHWDGSQWTQTGMPVSYEHGTFAVLGVFFLDEDHGWVCGPTLNVPSDEEESAIFHWDGSNWKKQTSVPEKMHIRALYMLNENDGWAVGHYGTILRWDGEDWSIYASALLQPFWTQLWFWGIIIAVASIGIILVVFLRRRRRPLARAQA